VSGPDSEETLHEELNSEEEALTVGEECAVVRRAGILDQRNPDLAGAGHSKGGEDERRSAFRFQGVRNFREGDQQGGGASTGGSFPTCRAAHKNAIDFLIINK
jgi:hypothetical protein